MESGGREEGTESKLQSEVSAVVMWSAGVGGGGGGWFALFLPSPESTQRFESTLCFHHQLTSFIKKTTDANRATWTSALRTALVLLIFSTHTDAVICGKGAHEPSNGV